MKKFFNKEGKKPAKQKKLHSRLLLKHGTYNAVLIAIVLVAVVILNVLATAAANRFPMDIDLSLSGENTISEENADYLKTVDKDVNVVVCATEDGYTGGYMASYAYSMYMAQDSSGAYYEQTIKLLESYEKYNSKIKVTFQDPDSTAFSAVKAIVPDTTLNYGDILVYSSFELDGKDVTRTKVLTFTDLYELYDSTGYASMGYGVYSLSGSNVETAVTSAISNVTSEDIKKVGYLSAHSTSGAFDTLKSNLELNGFEIVEISDTIISEISSDIDAVAIAAPSADFAADEIAALETFLENGGKKGKSLMVFCDAAGADMPNLYAFLKEWGVSCEQGSVIFETDENNYLSGDPTTVGLVNAKTDTTSSVNNANKIYIAGTNMPLTAAYTSFGNRTTEVILTTQDTAVAAPITADADWTPGSEYTKRQYAAAIVTTDKQYDDDYNELASNVIVFSSVDFISSVWAAYDSVGNNAFTLAALKNVCGKDTSEFSFIQKTVATYNFTQPSEGSVQLMRVIFIIVLPVVLLAVGIFVWYRRKNR